MSIRAEWVVNSKDSTSPGYQILHTSSGAPSKGAADLQLRHYLPGNPVGGEASESSSALPWVWFAPADDGALSAAIMVSSHEIDIRHRAVSPTYGYWIDRKTFLTEKPSYASLATAIRDNDLGLADGQPSLLHVHQVSSHEVATRSDFDRLARIAAQLLETPVILRVKHPSSLEERLRDLDAITALLPYGFRLDLAASSWINDGGRNLRLGFTDGRSLARQLREHETSWDDPPEPTGELARDYYRLLQQLIGLQGEEAVITHLLQDNQARTFEQPESAIAWLESLARPFMIWQAIVDGKDRVADVRGLVQSADIPDGAADDFARHLLFLGESKDLPAIAAIWSGSPRVESALRMAVATRSSGKLDDPYIAFADRMNLLDTVLAAVLQGGDKPSDDPPPVPGRFRGTVFPQYPDQDRVLVRMLNDAVSQEVLDATLQSVLNVVNQRPMQTWKRVGGALEQNPVLAYRLANLAVQKGTSAVGVLESLGIMGKDAPRELDPLARLLRTRKVNATDLPGLYQVDSNLLTEYVGLLDSLGMIPDARHEIGNALINFGSHRVEQSWTPAVELLFPVSNAGPPLLAYGDALRFRLDNLPQGWWGTRLSDDKATDYIQQLRNVLTKFRSPRFQSEMNQRIAMELSESLDAWIKEPWAERALELLRVGIGNKAFQSRDAMSGDSVDARDVAARAFIKRPELLSTDISNSWRRDLQENPVHRAALVNAEFLSFEASGKTTEELAAHCGRYFRKQGETNNPENVILRWVKRNRINQNPASLVSFLIALDADLDAEGISPKSRESLSQFLIGRLVGTGAVGSPAIVDEVRAMRRHIQILGQYSDHVASTAEETLSGEDKKFVQKLADKSREITSEGGLLNRLGRKR